MPVFSDKKIKELLEKDKLKIIPFDEFSVTSNGYDMLTENFEISPREFKIVKSSERIKMPNNLVAIPFLRTTYAFKGLFLSGGIIDAGFQGHLKFALFNTSEDKITISESERIIHLIFLEMDGKAEFPFGTRKGEIQNS